MLGLLTEQLIGWLIDVMMAWLTACFLLSADRTRRQENAPTDASGVIGSIYDRMNEDLDDVVKLEINYVGGVIHRWGVFVVPVFCGRFVNCILLLHGVSTLVPSSLPPRCRC